MEYTGMEKLEESNMKNYVGLTIKSVNTNAINCTGIEFTDGTKILIEPENIGHGIYTPSVYEVKNVNAE